MPAAFWRDVLLDVGAQTPAGFDVEKALYDRLLRGLEPARDGLDKHDVALAGLGALHVAGTLTGWAPVALALVNAADWSLYDSLNELVKGIPDSGRILVRRNAGLLARVMARKIHAHETKLYVPED